MFYLLCLIRSLPKSASFDETQTQTALDVVRTKRAKQLLNQEKVTRQSSSVSGHSASTARTTKSGLVMSGDYTERTVGCADMRGDYTERTVGCADMVAEKVTRSSKTPTPHHSRPTTPQRSPRTEILLFTTNIKQLNVFLSNIFYTQIKSEINFHYCTSSLQESNHKKLNFTFA